MTYNVEGDTANFGEGESTRINDNKKGYLVGRWTSNAFDVTLSASGDFILTRESSDPLGEYDGENTKATLSTADFRDGPNEAEWLATNALWFGADAYPDLNRGLMDLVGLGIDQPATLYGELRDTVTVTGSQTAATITFNRFEPENDIEIVSGTVDRTAGGFGDIDGGPTWASWKFDEVTVKYTDGGYVFTVTYNGEIDLLRSGQDTGTLTFNMDASWEGATYRMEGVELSVGGPGVISGRYYDPVLGYVEITTPTPVLGEPPDTGVVQFTGENGYFELDFSQGGDLFCYFDGCTNGTAIGRPYLD
ncbi:hypothetical protein LRD18_07015 [Halorhodospira halochloris]|uniref:hypothetical protein n=1 Tax=Halorhodospira halochloris TaxID=1052 RepID=UPI001EE8FEE8|nr:hypothetical protein [Halorhodospira halochloris]MCG5530623.1 hypothetical protein [Halorhodospira halochloris]